MQKYMIWTLLPLGVALGAAAEDVSKDERARIAEQLPAVGVEDISASPVEGIYEISLGPQVAYISADGRYLFTGDIIDLKTQRNLTDARRNGARLHALSDIGRSQMIVFSPAQKPKHTITVFTDIDCGYCRKLHSEMSQLNALGIEVQYMFYPRSGPDTESWKKAADVWCADNRNEALTLAKLGKSIEHRQCQTPLSTHYEMAQMVGLRGTPAIVTEDGTLLSGYLPARDLAAHLDQLSNRP